MKKTILLASALVFLISCKNESTEQKVIENTHYQPAFPGQTRAEIVTTQTPYAVDIITKNLGLAWAVTNLPNNKLLITNKEKAEMFVVDLANPDNPKKVTGFPEINLTTQGGMLDVIADPDFENNRIIYWTYAEPLHDEENNDRTAVAKGKLAVDESQVENVEVIYRTFPVSNSGLHYGNRLAFDKDGYLFVSFGERSNADMRKFSQDLSSPLGKVLRLTKDGKAAPGNPFANTPNALPEIYSLGHRNPQSLAFDAKGQLWEIEHGPQGGDELNLIKPGTNYGWPIITYGVEYSDEIIGDAITQQEGLEQPVYYWDPVIAPSGAEFYNGNIEEWQGNLFVGGLKTQLLGRLIIKDNKVVGEEHLLKDQNDRIRDMVTGADGNLYVVGDQGKLYRISKK
ncbi:PQQ-dependent sugar dehydrogenase [Flavobacterium agricola]|uniref:PQQ-dependent sugar dehydrogenase n=1 Tax=Flavobacterium agricola TaxID=2870839 RepID=A0ABY6M1I7_9FLAO|nr:PQQ-dependent sugar dehydrogenase [Flavobacterium agricola]UYW01575.1 PQQ-dependent sugar dehydrogenase [Flavobacterium agricola]